MGDRQYPLWITEYIGIPFNKDGWTKEDGFHCWSLVRHVLIKGFDITIPTYQEKCIDAYDYKNMESAVFSALENQWNEVKTPSFGDLLFFRINKNVCHVGMCLDETFMLHIMKGINTSLSRYRTPQWIPRLYGAYRHESL